MECQIKRVRGSSQKRGQSAWRSGEVTERSIREEEDGKQEGEKDGV